MAMDLSALGGCHQPIFLVSWGSSMKSESSSKLRFSSFFSFIPAGARLFFLGVLALLLILPCSYHVGAAAFAFNGIQESDVCMVSDRPWTAESKTSCFYFDPSESLDYDPGLFLYPSFVHMKDPDTKQFKSFRSNIIYHFKIQKAINSTIGPGKTFIVDPDNRSLGAAAKDYMGIFSTDTSTSTKNYKSGNHALGGELDTFKKPKFDDPRDNHIGVDLASMLSTFIVNPVYSLGSVCRYDVHTHVWIDYFEVDSHMDIYIGVYGKGKPTTPQGSQTGRFIVALGKH